MSFDLTDLNGRKIYEREAGILMPIFSLPGDYGIGDLGDNAKRFIDKLENSQNEDFNANEKNQDYENYNDFISFITSLSCNSIL